MGKEETAKDEKRRERREGKNKRRGVRGEGMNRKPDSLNFKTLPWSLAFDSSLIALLILPNLWVAY